MTKKIVLTTAASLNITTVEDYMKHCGWNKSNSLWQYLPSKHLGDRPLHIDARHYDGIMTLKPGQRKLLLATNNRMEYELQMMKFNAKKSAAAEVGAKNFYTITGVSVPETDIHYQRMPAWAPYKKGTDLFISGAGSFDIKAVCQSYEPRPDGRHAHYRRHWAIAGTTPAEFIATGYLLKNNKFNGYDNLHLWYLGRFLSAAHRRKYFGKWHVQLMSDRFINQIDELVRFGSKMDLSMPPAQLLNVVEETRAKKLCGDLVHYKWLQNQPDREIGGCVVHVIKDSHELYAASRTLRNCSYDYSNNVAEKKTIILTVIEDDKTVAMAEYSVLNARYNQMSGFANSQIAEHHQNCFQEVLPLLSGVNSVNH